jgi:hypothetical protein
MLQFTTKLHEVHEGSDFSYFFLVSLNKIFLLVIFVSLVVLLHHTKPGRTKKCTADALTSLYKEGAGL